MPAVSMPRTIFSILHVLSQLYGLWQEVLRDALRQEVNSRPERLVAARLYLEFSAGCLTDPRRDRTMIYWLKHVLVSHRIRLGNLSHATLEPLHARCSEVPWVNWLGGVRPPVSRSSPI